MLLRRGWIAIDGKPIAHFDTHLSFKKHRSGYHETTNVPWPSHPAVPDSERSGDALVEPGEFSRYDLSHACWDYLHSSLNDSVASPNPLIASLAVLNAGVGKHRLRRISQGELHPLTRALLKLRLEAENASPHPSTSPARRF